jgi:hypothetical protein
MITASSAFLTANAKQQKRPIYLVDIDGYPWSFCNRKVTFPAEPAAPFYDVVEGPFPSQSNLPMPSYWDNSRKSLFWIGYNPNGVTATIFELQDGVVDYHEVTGLPAVTGGGVNAHWLAADDHNFYLLAANGAGYESWVRISRTDYSFQAWMGGLGVFGGPYYLGSNGITANIGANWRLVVFGKRFSDGAGIVRIHLTNVSDMSNLDDLTLQDTTDVQMTYDSSGFVWAVQVSGGTAWVNKIDWTGGTPGIVTSYDTGVAASSIGAVTFSASAAALIIHTSDKILKWDIATHAVVGTITDAFAGMSAQPGSDGLIVCGVNKLNPVAFTLATTLLIADFGLPNSFTGTNKFARAYNSTRDVFYAIDTAGNVWGLRCGVAGANGIRPWMKNPEDLDITIDELNGSSSLGKLSFNVLDHAHLITADFPNYVFEGKKVRLRTGFPGMLRSEFVTMFTGVIVSVESMDGNLGYNFVCSDGKARLNQVIWTTGDDGVATDSDHPRTINGNPLDILLSILQTEIAMLSSEINVAKIEQYRDTIFAGMQFVFNITDPPQALDFIQKQLMIPLGGYIWTRADGVTDVNFLYPLGGVSSSMSIDQKILDVTPTAGQTDLKDVVTFRFDKNDDPSGSGNADFLSVAVQKYQPGINKYGLYGQQVIESDGVRSGFQGNFIAAFCAQMIFLKYGFKNLTFDGECLWVTVLLEPGDFVLISHPRVPDRVNGVFGITNWLMQVLDRTWAFNDGKVTLKLIDASGLLRYGQFKIAPDDIPTWTLATSPQKARYMFLSKDNGTMSDGATAPVLG